MHADKAKGKAERAPANGLGPAMSARRAPQKNTLLPTEDLALATNTLAAAISRAEVDTYACT